MWYAFIIYKIIKMNEKLATKFNIFLLNQS